jgi:hypothetical protein
MHIFQRHFVTLCELFSTRSEEVSVVRFVSYLEPEHSSWSATDDQSHEPDHSSWSATDDQSQEGASLRSICASDIDSVVRSIRSTVLSILLGYLSRIQRPLVKLIVMDKFYWN